MSAAARAVLGSLKVSDNAVSASYKCVVDAEREQGIAGKAVAEAVDASGKPRVSPITLVSKNGTTAPPASRYVSLDLEDFQ
jgi:hypothetical protein